ncbi:MAG: hypothetical protein U1E05_12570, partial [Patescibacteria group bacterium]|nr:hypothetical protein [Patescibacteria group bacterium]
MKKNMVLALVGAVAWWGLAAGTLLADSADAIFARGQTQLAAGQFSAALESFAAAATANPNSEEYAARFEKVRKVVALRGQLETEQDASRWTAIARALHMFYHQEKVFAAAAEVDRQLHKRLQNGLSATLLAQTLMAMDQPAEAAAALQALPEEHHNLGTHTTLVLALARAGDAEQAAKVAGRLETPKQLCAGKAFMVARMKAAVGDEPAAADLLKQAFAATPANRLPAFKAAATRCAELAAMFEKEPYRDVLNTESRVAARPAPGHDADDDNDHDHDHDDHDHKDGHCATCPLQERVEDMAAKPKASGCDGCKR